jgi:hypothetical protein
LWTPFDIFDDVSYIGNTRIDPCSRILKRETFRNFLNTIKLPDITIAVGIHAQEVERTISLYENYTSQGYNVIFPLLEWQKPEGVSDNELLQEWYGVTLHLYDLGFEHNNCAGACVKAGQRQWALVWYHFPQVYQEWEDRQEQWIERTGKKHSFLRKTIDGKLHYITLKEFREQYLEPAACSKEDNFLVRFIRELPGSPPCAWCAAI